MTQAPFRLTIGDQGPVQQSPITCGSASLIVARMLTDPDFGSTLTGGAASWGLIGAASGPASTGVRHEAAMERAMMARTNGFRGPLGLQLPWPRQWGTPPWGAKRELSAGGTRYRTRLVRFGSSKRQRTRLDDLRSLTGPDRPVALYVGNRWLPRHVCLVTADDAGALLVYDPAIGAVNALSDDAFANGKLGLGGWPKAWFLVQPKKPSK